MQVTIPNYDVIVLGLGPVGLLACNLLGQSGKNILGIERTNSTSFNFPRAIHIDDEIVRIVQSIGLQEQLLQHIKPASGLELLDANFKVMVRGKTNFPSGYASNHFLFLQPELENILRNGCTRFANVSLLYNTEITEIKQIKDEVLVLSKENKIAKTKYLIGSDGANSFTRNSLEIGMKSLGFHKAILKVDADSENKNLVPLTAIQKICSASKPYVHMNGVGNHLRWEINFTNDLSKEEIEKPENISRLLKEIGVDSSKLNIKHAVLYFTKSTIAKQWQKENIFLAGDAAHTTPPYIGQGMCSGMRDAKNLCWKLNEVLDNRLPKTALNTYQSERYPHTKRFILLANIVGWLFTTQLWYLLKLASKIPILNKKLLNINLKQGKLGKGIFGTGKAKRLLFPQIQLNNNEYSDSLLNNQWSLVSVGECIEIAIQTLCKKCGLNYLEIKSSENNYKEIEHWATKYNASYFILRPDQYVYSSGNNAKELINKFNSK